MTEKPQKEKDGLPEGDRKGKKVDANTKLRAEAVWGIENIPQLMQTNSLVAEQLSTLLGKPIDKITLKEALPYIEKVINSPKQ